ncbi:hypothetical protein DMJ13_23395 [halophilic archaeon]|nr:hypothetical protein DMJ13_23395 [halophilic archaeon]
MSAAQETTTQKGQGTTAMQGVDVTESYRFGGRVQAWIGRQPQAISGQQNPTLEFRAGNMYEITWKNLDGQPHNWAFQDAQGNNLPVIFPNVQTDSSGNQTAGNQTTGGTQTTGTGTAMGTGTTTGNQTTGGTVTPPENAIPVTNIVSEQGATQTFRFVATRRMSTYLCTVHPTTMVGDVSLQGSGGGSSGN